MSGCRRRSPTRACAPPWWYAGAGPTSACSSYPSTWRNATPPSCSRSQGSGSGAGRGGGCGVGGVGYLLKDRVADLSEFLGALDRVAAGGSALDPEVVAQLLARSRHPLAALTAREREVLALMAEGRTNAAIAAALVVGEGAVEKHINSIFAKLDLAPADRDHRRVLAVLRYLGAD